MTLICMEKVERTQYNTNQAALAITAGTWQGPNRSKLYYEELGCCMYPSA